MKLQEVTGYNSKTARILKESYQDLTESQIIYLNKWEKELWPLVEQYTKLAEAELTKDQIIQIFQGAEKVAMDSGDNKTIAGKVGGGIAAAAKLPVDIAKKVDAKINELGRMAQNAGPIKNADAKFEQLKKDIMANKPDSKVVQGIQKVSDWAKENPGKASLAVGILTTIAAFAGGPAGGAAAGLILRASKDLLQGEKLSTAVGKSIKTAAYGAIAGWAMRGVGDWLEGLRADAVPYEKVPGLTQVDVGITKTLTAPGFKSVQNLGSMIVPADQAEQFSSLVQAAKGGDIDSFNELWNFSKTFDVKEFNELRNATNDMLQAVAQQNDAFLQNLTLANDAVAAIAQGTVSGKMDAKDIKVDGEPVQGELDLQGGSNTKESLSMEERFELYLLEADPAQGELPLDNPNSFSAKLKRGAKGLAGKAAGAVKGAAGAAANAIKQGAKDLGNKVTANKLMKTWKSMGEPLDSGSIANILQDAGMSNDQIKSIGQENKVDLAPSAQDTAQTGNTAQDTAQATDANADGKDDNTGKPVNRNPKIKVAKGAGQVANASDGDSYTWAGAQWVNNKTARVATKQVSAELGNPNLKVLADKINKAGVSDLVKPLLQV